ncbi:putative bifunctional diguanylate cyclase/phosphodiesterase [Kushneria phyllosphaerae]|uniref:Putative signaling protein CC_0091 n=1 Tax=Kushneria phyllosphaerae TaxID=2100822 RepID=A0A2R8CH67_9GAMM|nr:bifunctional diguanylate cyclase/phosphodiesterase [Kushneria phyllosphaerae]SPJ32231.1 putative signaling protein CC_0091 [Kushneria phyllosphaerae]
MRTKSYLLRQGLVLFAATLVILLLIAVTWEFWLEAPAFRLLGWGEPPDLDIISRWRFILTCTGFAAMAMVVPWMLSLRVIWRLRHRYRQLLAARARSHHLARHDALTDLMNRPHFMTRLHARVSPLLEQTALLVIDLDAFQKVNDAHGSTAGDYALRRIAGRLNQVQTVGDPLLGRLGGDEFVVALTGALSRHDLFDQAQALRRQIRQPLVCGNRRESLEATIGIAIAPLHATSADQLLAAAYDAMHEAKRCGENIRMQENCLPDAQQADAHRAQRLRQALDAGEIVPFYQPVVALSNRKTVGVEMLARWQHPERGLVPPDEFIPLIETLGLMPEMTRHLLVQAMSDARQWPGECFLAVNITASYLEDEAFVMQMATLLKAHAFPADRLEVEITENVLIERLDIVQENLTRLHDMGVRVSLDDFGTGYSGLYHLARLDVDKIKIDRSFFNAEEIRQDNLVRMIITMGRSLGMGVVAEGIEDERLAEHLAQQGCHFGQGYLFGRPMPAQALREHLMSGSHEAARLDTGDLTGPDDFSDEARDTGVRIEAEIRGPEDIRV